MGYVEGENLAISYRFAENQIDRLTGAGGRTGPAAGRGDRHEAATTTIPVVFLVGDDPVRLGLVASLARPVAT
jgi:putative ABC transport system substrate-binding protein